MTYDNFCYWAVAGAAGALVRICLVYHGRIMLPRFGRVPDGRLYLDVGFCGALVIGIACAVLVDNNWLMAFSSAIAGPHVLEGLVATLSELSMRLRTNG